MRKFVASKVVGKRIVAVNTNAYRAGRGSQRKTMHNFEMVLDDGTMLRFFVEEHPVGGDYGVYPVVVSPRRGGGA